MARVHWAANRSEGRWALKSLAILIFIISPSLADDTRSLKKLLRRANGGVVWLDARRVYFVREKLELKTLCPDGIVIEGNNAVIRALPDFRHPVLLTATVLLRDTPYSPGVTVRNLNLDGQYHVSRCVFGNWQNAKIENLRVQGGTTYQINAIWQHSKLVNITVLGNKHQTNNGFDCNLQHSTIRNIRVDMQGNLTESAFWLNGSQFANVHGATLTDGRTGFGLENCKDVNVRNMRIRGRFSFRVVNILPADPSERIYLYNVDIDTTHVGTDAATGIHFNATRGGKVVGGIIRSRGPGVLLTHGASGIDVIDVDLPGEPVAPLAKWASKGPKNYASIRR